MKFLNISNHILTQEQIEDIKKVLNTEEIEIVELPQDIKSQWGNLTPDNYEQVCERIIQYMKNNEIKHAHLAGFTPAVVYMVTCSWNYFFYSYSERVSEEKESNGEIVKTSIFKYKDWYEYQINLIKIEIIYLSLFFY